MKRALFVLAACGGSQPAPAPVVIAPVADAAVAVVDAPAVSDDEKLAAIQKAMNELAPAAQQCWAASAVVRFDIEGEMAAMIDIGPPAKATISRDTTRHPELALCVQKLLEAYPWAPPLKGQTIQLPFAFKAPEGQSVIDRRLVPFAGQGKTNIAVLLDENNSGNASASMFEVAIAAGGSTGMRVTPRAELWFALAPLAINKQPLARFDLAYVPAGGAREVTAGADAHAVVLAFPGQPEGAARAGALPTPEGTSKIQPVIVHASAVKHWGDHDVYIEKPNAAVITAIPAGGTIPEHEHPNETELIYFLEGTGTLTIAGKTLPTNEFSVVQIPPHTKHSGTATTAMKIFHVYTPGGPEQRWKK
ncbi:MAG: cupin domain-containing protein [Kofleriaceae bacterium]